jgi:hypothetical protein
MLREMVMNSVASAYQNKIFAEICRGRAGPMFLQRAVRNAVSAREHFARRSPKRREG